MNKAEAADEIGKMSFEEALAELKGIVERLEQGDGKLEESIDIYQRGALLKQHCDSKLRAAQERIEKITLTKDGQPTGSEPLDLE
ncbi:exodeoxyribonuclease VII small subunit [Limibacillus halophilus]|uniref:Exodeoxyribonuclease 7 small subunit n=1 Tax=Limibacillus halophilus TaxID=1579333 RepID=A0A839SVY0_9PROT|nr:exodeoxyribonuclease VII small subunit [Limibacillus halophilus]MBB3065103.1 exodeoxyribonuclease VII small subunit [Limibacillus halophilus]